MSYEEQLKDRRWFLTRKVILLRDNNQCTRCGSKRHLQAHHLYYTSGKMAWDYPLEALVTLCRHCHEVTHGKLNIDSRSGEPQGIALVLLNMIDNQINNINHG